MNRLPKVLQKEIWEYVHGDRAHWRECFKETVDHLEAIADYAEAGTFDLTFSPEWQSKREALFGSAMKWKRFSFDASVLVRRRRLSSRNFPVYCDSRDDYEIHIRESIEFRMKHLI